MRMCNRNKQTFWYAAYDKTVIDYDDNGFECGSHTTYGKPVKAEGNISPAKGSVISRQFGDDDSYDKVLAMEDRDCPIDEYSVLWVDIIPELDESGALALDDNGNEKTPCDYKVRRVGRGLPEFGSAMFTLVKVSVSSGRMSGGVSA